jgi:hypothetical protein
MFFEINLQINFNAEIKIFPREIKQFNKKYVKNANY